VFYAIEYTTRAAKYLQALPVGARSYSVDYELRAQRIIIIILDVAEALLR